MSIDAKDKARSYFDQATTAIAKAEETAEAVWAAPTLSDDDFQEHIKTTAKLLLSSIEKTATSPYALEAKELALLTKSVCDLQQAFFGKSDTGGTMIMTNQLSMFKGML